MTSLDHASATVPAVPRGLTRRTCLAAGLTAALPLPTLAVDVLDSMRRLAGQVPCLRIGLVDVSTSLDAGPQTDERTVRALKAFFGKAQAGDELVVGSIGDARMDRVRLQGRSVARTGKLFEDKKRMAKALEEQLTWAQAELARPRTAGTRCVETLAAHQPAVSRALQQGSTVQVLIAGDGVESSEWCNFDDPRQLNERTVPKLVGDLAKRRMLLCDTAAGVRPGQVQMMLVGAGGRTSGSWQDTRSFWETYCRTAGIQLLHYGPDLPPFL